MWTGWYHDNVIDRYLHFHFCDCFKLTNRCQKKLSEICFSCFRPHDGWPMTILVTLTLGSVGWNWSWFPGGFTTLSGVFRQPWQHEAFYPRWEKEKLSSHLVGGAQGGDTTGAGKGEGGGGGGGAGAGGGHLEGGHRHLGGCSCRSELPGRQKDNQALTIHRFLNDY